MENLKAPRGLEEEHCENEALYLLLFSNTFSVSQEREV